MENFLCCSCVTELHVTRTSWEYCTNQRGLLARWFANSADNTIKWSNEIFRSFCLPRDHGEVIWDLNDVICRIYQHRIALVEPRLLFVLIAQMWCVVLTEKPEVCPCKHDLYARSSVLLSWCLCSSFCVIQVNCYSIYVTGALRWPLFMTLLKVFPQNTKVFF